MEQNVARQHVPSKRRGRRRAPLLARVATAIAFALAVACTLALVPSAGVADSGSPVSVYQSLDELKGKRIAYVNGSVYNQAMQKQVEGTSEQFYASLADCVKAVESDKADAAVQLSYCIELVVNRRDGAVAMLPQNLGAVDEAFFFPHGDPMLQKFNEIIDKYEADGTIDSLKAKWVGKDDSVKQVPAQDWDAPNGTLNFATSGVIEPYSYVGAGGEALGYDVDLALHIAKDLGYRLNVQTIPMDSIFAAVQTHKVDFGGTLTRTDERAQVVDFSKKVMPSYISVVTKAKEGTGGGLEYNSPEELDGHKVGVVNGTMTDRFVDAHLGGSRDYSYYNTPADLVAALKAGKVDAFCADEPVAVLSANNNDGIGIVPGKVADDQYGMIFQKGSALKGEFDAVIEEFRADGTLERLKTKWTGSDADAKTMPEPGWDAPKGTLKMTTCATLDPMTYTRGDEVVGYDIELAELVCKRLGYGLEVVNQEFPACLAGVESGKFDFGASAISISDERKQQVDFSVPTYDSAPVFVVRTKADPGAFAGFLETMSRSFKKTFIEENRWQLILSGLGVTLLVSVCSGVLGTLLGYLTVLARRSGVRWIGKVVDGYQALMGGIPLVVVLMVLYYVVFGAFDIAGEIVAVIAFTLSFGATAGSTMWTAVAGIDEIQEETGLALGYTRRQVFHKIIFPQAAEQFRPQLVGQFVSLTKETAIVGYIAVQDLTRASDLIRARTMDAFFPLISTAVIYFILCRLIAWALRKATARLDTSARPREIEGVSER